jgi:hypothetical protein
MKKIFKNVIKPIILFQDDACQYTADDKSFTKPTSCPVGHSTGGASTAGADVSTTTAGAAGLTTTTGASGTTTTSITLAGGSTTTTGPGGTTTTSTTLAGGLTTTTGAGGTTTTSTTLSGGALPPNQAGRKKRQAGSGPGSGRGPILPPVNADFETSSIFLQKYMQLSEADRIAIGHRLTYKFHNCFFFLDSKNWKIS